MNALGLRTALGTAIALGWAGVSYAAQINVPADQPTIQDAINVAVNGDLVAVAAGTYNETIDFLGKEITVKSLSGLPALTIIDGGGAGPVVTMDSGETIDSQLSGFTITGGFTVGNGAGIVIRDGGATIDNCRIDGNEAAVVAGGAYVRDSTGAAFTQCRFRDNISGGGGAGAYVSMSTDVTFDGCNFVSNTGTTAIFFNQSDATMSKGKFTDNDVLVVVDDLLADVQIANSLFYDNLAADPIVSIGGTAKLANCTFAKHAGEALSADSGGTIFVSNSIVRGQGAAEVDASGGTVEIVYSNVNGGYAGGNLNLLPGYVDFANDDFHLDWHSPCIDAADADEVPAGEDALDLDRNDRMVNNYAVTDTGAGSVSYLDMGAYEGGSPVRFVDINATGAGDGTSWNDAYTELKVAMDDAALADDVLEIWVAGATYKADLGSGDRTASFELVDGVSLYGGFNGAEIERADRDPVANPTTLGGAIGGAGSAGNSYHLITGVDISSDTVIDGFIMQRANANDAGDPNGAGVHLVNSSPVFVQCIIRQNEGTGSGTAVFSADGNPEFRRCRINLNVGGSSTMYFLGGSPLLENCAVHGNTSTLGGSAVYFSDTDDAVMVNGTVWGNHSGAWAGGIFVFGGNLDLANTISWGNTRDNENVGTPIAANIWNSGGTIDGYHNTIGEYDTGSIFTTDVENFGYDPMFVDADGGDNVPGTLDDNLRLSANSRSIDSGDNTLVDAAMTLDFPGLPRRLDDTGMPDTGNGTAPLVDRGAAEFTGTSCLADIDGSGDVGFSDLVALLAQWGTCPGCGGDLNLDGDVGFSDLVALLAAWGPC